VAFFGKDYLFKSDVTAATPTDDCISTTSLSITSPIYDDHWSNSQSTGLLGDYEDLREY